MMNILLVDDELLIRNHIKTLMNWEQHGYKIIGEASNGQQALSMIETLNPDIVLSDIKMPGMDGVELSHALNSKHPNIALIILSNYDDYGYVRETLKNGAKDYILKHNLTATSMVQLLDSLTLTCASNNINVYSTSQLKELQDKLIQKIISGIIIGEASIATQLTELKLDFLNRHCITLLMSIDNYNLTKDSDYANDYLTISTISNICDELLVPKKLGLCTYMNDGNFLITLGFDSPKKEAITLSLNNIIKRIQRCLQDYLNITASFSIGKLVNNICLLSSSYQESVHNIENKFFSGTNSILNGSTNKKDSPSTVEQEIPSTDDIAIYLETDDCDGLIDCLTNIYQTAQASSANQHYIYDITSKLLLNVNHFCNVFNIPSKDVYKDYRSAQYILSKVDTIDGLKDALILIYQRLYTQLSPVIFDTDNRYIKETIIYIAKNYPSDLSLAVIAEHLCVNSSYLSTLFKKETNISFTQYLTNYRLNKAKHFINQKKYALKTIAAMSGFKDYNYFFKVFKKYVGTTPTDYQRRD